MKYFLLLSFVISSCSTIPPFDGTPKPKPDEGEIRAAWNNPEWTALLYKEIVDSSLGESTAPYQETYCPKGLTDRNWLHLFVAMAKYESNFNPETEYQENFNDRFGNPIISTGLFQLSRESARGYGCHWISSDFKQAQRDLKDPAKNIRCAVKIADRWVSRDNRIAYGDSNATAKGLGRYWAVMRNRLRPKVKAYLKPWCQ